jgi:REP element-mobilizing transposase RayT
MRQLPLGFVAPQRRRPGRPRLTDKQRRMRGSLVPRVTRPELKARHPLHVTLRAKRDVPSLRTKGRFLRMRDALRAAADRFGMRVVHFAVLDDHVHLIVEAHDKHSLSRGMQGLAIRVAKAINRGERRGRVFRDRYHSVVLETPRQVRNAIAYVVLNARRHDRRNGQPPPARWIDPCSSGYWFDGWRGDVRDLRRVAERHLDFPACAPVSAPRTWLLGIGWRRTKLIDPSEVPGH